jgi:hypothetical protein
LAGQWFVVGLVGKGDQDTQDAPIYSGFLEIISKLFDVIIGSFSSVFGYFGVMIRQMGARPVGDKFKDFLGFARRFRPIRNICLSAVFR